MSYNFDLCKATDIVLRYYDFYIKGYDPQRFHQQYIAESIPEEFDPRHWVDTADTVANDYARLLKRALEYVDMGKLSYKAINLITKYFRCYCIAEKSILIEEIEKENDLFGCMIESEFDSIGERFCNVTRRYLDIWINITLDKQKALELYREADESDWELIGSASMINEEIVNKYLLRRLSNEKNVKWIDSILESLGDNKVASAYDIIFNRIMDKFSYDSSVLFALVEFTKNVQGENARKLLSLITINDMREHIDDLPQSIEVAKCMLKGGEEGLVNLFENTEDHIMKYEIIHCYKFFRTKFFSQLLLTALNDPYHLDNGYYPIRSNAYAHLERAPYEVDEVVWL